MADAALDTLPGYRRRLVVMPAPGRVRSELEDDYHRMAVTIDHAGGIATRVSACMTRVPWTTCPGAEQVVETMFTGVRLDEFLARGPRTANCTHLHDLALLAAAHAGDPKPTVFEIIVSDPVAGVRRAELRRDGHPVLGWTMADDRFVTPPVIAGLRLDQLRGWIATLDRDGQEHARLLRWGTMLSHGRQRSGATEFDMARLPLGQCFTFQPDNAARTKYKPETVRSFDAETPPLAELVASIAIGAAGASSATRLPR